MPTYARYTPASTPVSNLVIELLTSFDEGREATLIPPWVKDPDLSSVNVNNPMRYNGTAIVNLTQPEIDSVKAATDAQNLAALKQAAKDIFDVPTGAQNQAISLGFATMRDLMLSEINLLRAAVVPSLPARTIAQFNTQFQQAYVAKVNALT